MAVKKNEFRFLVFFLPIFFLKLINITVADNLLVVVSIICFSMAMLGYLKQKINKRVLVSLGIAATYTGILMFTCGKQGAFFSVITVILMYRLRNIDRVYYFSLIVGVIGILVSCYIERNVGAGTRFNGVEWITVFKRSNILFISFAAVVVIYIYRAKETVNRYKTLIILSVLGYSMYKYSGSRTGALCFALLVVLMFLTRFSWMYRNKLFRLLGIRTVPIRPQT